MKKTLSLVLVTVLALSLLAGCTSQPPAASKTPEELTCLYAQATRLATLKDGTILMVMCENQDEIFEGIKAVIEG